ncbi:hypothetical protein [Cochleicola gelatinilyticus]|nr:hypothetical protein [Cochleicola gelatinilyticus]
MNALINNIKLIIFLSVTLGFAPFFPGPPIWAKLKWIVGGANSMDAAD